MSAVKNFVRTLVALLTSVALPLAGEAGSNYQTGVGSVSPGSTNNLGYYSASGSTISPLSLSGPAATCVNGSGLLTTSCTTIAKGVLFAQTATVTVANTTTETTLLGAGVGTTTLPANFFAAGTTLKFKMYGFHSASGTPTLDYKIYLDSTVILDTTAVTTAASTSKGLNLEALITCATTGTGGTLNAGGIYTEATGAATPSGMVATSPISIDTTVSHVINVTVTWGTAAVGNTLTVTNLTVEAEI